MGTRKIDAPVLPITGRPLAIQKQDPVQSPFSEETTQQNNSPLQQKSELGKGVALLVPGLLFLLAGFFYASSSKAAGNFDTFYQQMVIGNIVVTLGVVMLYNALGIFGVALIGFIRTRRNL